MNPISTVSCPTPSDSSAARRPLAGGPPRFRQVDPSDTFPHARAEVVRTVREKVAHGEYRPSVDAVAEALVAWAIVPAPGVGSPIWS